MVNEDKIPEEVDVVFRVEKESLGVDVRSHVVFDRS